MYARTRPALVVACALLTMSSAFAGPDSEAHAASQTAVDLLREAAGAEVAFIAAEMIRPKFDPADLKTLMKYPTDEVAVVTLSGSQIRKALERSISLFPTPNDSFLQVSNLDITFSKRAEPDQRIVSVMVGNNKLEDGRKYTVAMPSSLAKGSQGYFKVWERSQIKSVLSGVTLETVLGGKAAKETEPRWHPTN